MKFWTLCPLLSIFVYGTATVRELCIALDEQTRKSRTSISLSFPKQNKLIFMPDEIICMYFAIILDKRAVRNHYRVKLWIRAKFKIEIYTSNPNVECHKNRKQNISALWQQRVESSNLFRKRHALFIHFPSDYFYTNCLLWLSQIKRRQHSAEAKEESLETRVRESSFEFFYEMRCSFLPLLFLFMYDLWHLLCIQTTREKEKVRCSWYIRKKEVEMH